MNFKVGDRVKIGKQIGEENYSTFVSEGNTGIVSSIDESSTEYSVDVRLNKNGKIEAFMPQELILLGGTVDSSKIKFAKLREDVIIPSKREEDGAFDIYANFEEDYIEIKPHETKLIPTGLISAFSSDYVAILKERGSNGTKGMAQRAGVIDSKGMI